jgi:uncharacterized protein
VSGVDHIAGQTYHGRRGATKNAFRYSIDYVLLDAEAQVAGPSLFSRNGRNLTALHDRDHGGAPHQGRGAVWAREVLAAHAIDLKGRIDLLAQPRVLGHVFNPVSFWLCHDPGGVLRVVIAEVTNTFGDRHSYLCHHDDLREITKAETITARKLMHVSPFQPVEGAYTFRFDITPDRIGIWIDYSRGNGGVIATLTGQRKPLTNGGILRAVLRRPFGSRRVLALIHWQALILWWKGATFRSRPPAPVTEVSK